MLIRSNMNQGLIYNKNTDFTRSICFKKEQTFEN